MNKPAYIPQDYDLVRIAQSMDEVYERDFDLRTNAILLPRRLTATFNALAEEWRGKQNVYTIFSFTADLNTQKLSPEARHEAGIILSDAKAAARKGYSVFIHATRGVNHAARIIYDFHADGSVDGAWRMGRIHCCYNEGTTQWLRNEDTVYLRGCLYAAREGAQIHSFGNGDIWRHSMADQGLFSPPFIHRAPPPASGARMRFTLSGCK